MYAFLVVVQVLVAVALVALVLIQHGKGADAGAAFGSGASGTVFGSRGSANFLTRATAWLATAFFGISLALAYLVSDRSTGGSVVDEVPAAAAPAAPIAGASLPAAAPAAAAQPAPIPEAAPAVAAPAATPAQPQLPE